jgi:hypothetical protein
LLSLKADNSTSLLDYFYSDRYNQVKTTYNLNNLIKRLQFDISDDLKSEIEYSNGTEKLG